MERGIAFIAASLVAIGILLFAGFGAFLPVWIIGIIISYFVLKSFRSDSPVALALVWPIGLLVLGIAQVSSHRQPTMQRVEPVAPPPPPRAGMIGDSDDEDELRPPPPAAPPPPPPPPPPAR